MVSGGHRPAGASRKSAGSRVPGAGGRLSGAVAVEGKQEILAGAADRAPSKAADSAPSKAATGRTKTNRR